MGVKRLKIKNELNYKRGGTSRYCGGCDHFVSDFQVHGCDRDCTPLRVEPRCKIIGLENGRGYRIHPANVCDRYDNTERIRRLRNMTDMAGVNRA